MKAIRVHRRGGPENLVYEDAPVPELKAGDALVRVYATAITFTELTWDETYQNCDGTPRLPSIPGHELSGVVEEVSAGTTVVKPGEAVYGLVEFCRNGAAAEYVAVRAGDLAPKPRSLNHIQAASVPLAVLTAWQALFDQASLAAGQTVLVHGGAGGVGNYAVQLAHWRGARVIATASAQHADLLRKLGADEIIDYRGERFEERVRGVDVVLDTVGGDTLRRSWQVIRPAGVLVTIVAPTHQVREDVRGVFFIVEPHRSELMEITSLIEEGTIRVVIADCLPLERARDAFTSAARPHKPGKFVLQVKREIDTAVA